MNWKYILIACVLSLIACLAIDLPKPPQGTIAALNAAQTVMVLHGAEVPSIDTDDGLAARQVTCTGVIIAPRTVVTAAHCVRDVEFGQIAGTIVTRAEWERNNARPRQALMIDADARTDVALLGVWDPFDAPPAPLRLELPPNGEQVHTTHHGMIARGGLPWASFGGSVSGLIGDNSIHMIQADIDTDKGASGSGLFDSHGRLLGILSENAGPKAYYVPSSYVRELWK